MNKEITVYSTWYSDDDNENYSVTNIYVDDSGNTIICVTSLDSGVYEEWDINGFYRWFKFISKKDLDSFQEKVLPTNKLVDSIYKNNVESVTMNGHKDEAHSRSKWSTEEMVQAIVMHIHGVETIDIANTLDFRYRILMK